MLYRVLCSISFRSFSYCRLGWCFRRLWGRQMLYSVLCSRFFFSPNLRKLFHCCLNLAYAFIVFSVPFHFVLFRVIGWGDGFGACGGGSFINSRSPHGLCCPRCVLTSVWRVWCCYLRFCWGSRRIRRLWGRQLHYFPVGTWPMLPAGCFYISVPNLVWISGKLWICIADEQTNKHWSWYIRLRSAKKLDLRLSLSEKGSNPQSVFFLNWP
jgi:hypothetical protein